MMKTLTKRVDHTVLKHLYREKPSFIIILVSQVGAIPVIVLYGAVLLVLPFTLTRDIALITAASLALTTLVVFYFKGFCQEKSGTSLIQLSKSISIHGRFPVDMSAGWRRAWFLSFHSGT
jgi:hypothetical protein